MAQSGSCEWGMRRVVEVAQIVLMILRAEIRKIALKLFYNFLLNFTLQKFWILR